MRELGKLFEFVMEEVWSAGGDGDGVVVFRSSSVIEVADRFQEWMRAHSFLSKNPYRRYADSEHRVLFSDGSNESIIFISGSHSHEIRDGWNPEVWLEVK